MSNKEKTINKIFASIFNAEESHPFTDYHIDNISEWDSMKQLTIITAIENEFDIFIDVAEANTLTSYAKILDYLTNHPEID